MNCTSSDPCISECNNPYLGDEGSLSCLGLRFHPEEAPQSAHLLGLGEQLLALVLAAGSLVVLVVKAVARTRGAGPAGGG